MDSGGKSPNGSLVDEIVCVGARRVLAGALEAEVNAYLARLGDGRDGHGRGLVVRNGYRAEWTVATAAGPLRVKAPRVDNKCVDAYAGVRARFS